MSKGKIMISLSVNVRFKVRLDDICQCWGQRKDLNQSRGHCKGQSQGQNQDCCKNYGPSIDDGQLYSQDKTRRDIQGGSQLQLPLGSAEKSGSKSQ